MVKRERKGVKKAILRYRILKTAVYENKTFSLAEIELETGRTHQIRVQFASRKHPLFGDKKYGSKFEGNIGLFSHRITTSYITAEKNPPNELPWNLFL